MTKRLIALLTALTLLLGAALAEGPVSLDELITEIDKEAKALAVGPLSFAISEDRQSIYIDRPEVTGPDQYTIAYNIYDSNSNPVNYFYSLEERVAATPGYGGLFNVFVVVTDAATGEQNTSNIGWQELSWPLADRLTVGKASFEVSPDKKSIFVDRPSIACKSGKVTIAYNIYDHNSQPVNYFYSTEKRVAATPGYDGKFNVFIVVTDTETGEQDIQNIGWTILGEGPQPTVEPEPTTPPDADGQCGPQVYWKLDGTRLTIFGQGPMEDFDEIPWGNGSLRRADEPDDEEEDEPEHTENYRPDEWEGITSLTVAGTVTALGNYAFNDCFNLTSVSLAEGLRSIGEGTFRNCGMSSLRIPASVHIIKDSFVEGCFDLKRIDVEADNEAYASVDGVLYDKDVRELLVCPLAMETLKVPASVKVIRNGAFYYCQSLTRITLPEKLLTIGDYAFHSCINLREISIPRNVDTLGEGAFGECYSLETAVLSPRLTVIGDATFWGCRKLKGIELPAGLTRIGSSAFTNCESLAALDIPAGVTEIGDNAFDGCESLTSIVIPAGVTEIRGNMFNECTKLTSVTLPEGLTSIGFGAFSFCSSLKGIELPASLEHLGESVFWWCTGLEEITLPEGLKDVGRRCFWTCSALKKATFLGSQTRIEDEAFGMAFDESPVVTLYGWPRSTAQSYAEAYNIPFVLLTAE